MVPSEFCKERVTALASIARTLAAQNDDRSRSSRRGCAILAVDEVMVVVGLDVVSTKGQRMGAPWHHHRISHLPGIGSDMLNCRATVVE
jgi:hypothetical protein